MNKKIRWGVLGCAAIARVRTIPGLLEAENAKLYAVASRNITKAEETASLFGAERAYGSYEELLADPQVQAVYIPLPNSLHCEWVKKAAASGKHILCEKPLALDEAQAKEMFEVCDEQDVLLMEAFAYRHSPLVQKVRQIIEDGAIGKVLYLESHLTDVLTDMTNIRMNNRLGGGAFYDMACYDINVITYLTGKEPVSVKAFAQTDPEYGVDVANVMLMQFDDGALATAYSSLNSYPRGYYCITGDKGRIEVPCNFNCRGQVSFSVYSAGHTDNVEILDEIRTTYTVMCPQNYKLEIEQFGRCLLEGEKPLVDREETLRNARILDKAFADSRIAP